jgi:hypothetical protein
VRPAAAACNAGALCGSGTCTITGTHTIDDGCVLDFDAVGVTTLTVNGTLQTGTDGHSFTVQAATLAGSGTLKAHGGRLVVRTTGASPSGNIASSGTFDVRKGGSVVLYAEGDVSLQGDVNADGTSAPDAGSIEISGDAVTLQATVHAEGGGGGAGGRIDIEARSGSLVTQTSGNLSADACGTNSIPEDGGTISLRAATTMTLGRPIVTDGDLAGAGGVVHLTAGGAFTGTHNINARGKGGTTGAAGGEITLLASEATINGDWLATGEDSGDGGVIRVRTTTGDVDFQSGKFDVGTGGGGKAGDVRITAVADALVAGEVKANASGSTSVGGEIYIQAGERVEISDKLEALSTTTGGTQEDAIIELSGCEVEITGNVKARSGSGSGQTRIYYTESLTVTDVSLFADDNGGNWIGCACEDATADGACDIPLACRNDPVLTSVNDNPDVTVVPEYPTTCG